MRMNIDQARNDKVSREVMFLGQLWNILRRSDAGNDPVLGNDRVVLEHLLFGPLEELAASHMDLFDHRTPLFPSVRRLEFFPIDLDPRPRSRPQRRPSSITSRKMRTGEQGISS